jgi:hypothetical protein
VRAEGDAFLEQHARDVLRAGLARLNGTTYDRLVHEYLAVASPDDPRYDDLLRGAFLSVASDDYPILYDALFTRNEHEYGDLYLGVSLGFLANLSHEYVEQRVLVSGHLACLGGYTIVNSHHLRIASGVHAQPRSRACYLLLDCARRVENAGDLLTGLRGL